MVSFECDYIAGAHPEIIKRLSETNLESLPGYGMDHYTASAQQKIRKVCGCPDAQVELLVGGTQTNAVVISTMLRDWEGVIAADSGHVSVHESGAIEYSGHKVLALPGKDGKINPAILAAAKVAGIDKIFKVGGAQAIAALAYGTESSPKVDKIVGPGNAFVAEAKKQVYGIVSIDMIAGPSEILIIADDSAVPEFVAADFLSQAEHDKLASAILLTTSEKLADAVYEAVDRRSEKSLRKEILSQSLDTYCAILVVDDMEAALAFSEELAPEHLELCVEDPDNYIGRINNAGAIFVGNYTPEPLGDYFAGPNHTLPTSGTARFFSPLNTGDFFKKISVLRYNEESLRECYKDVAAFADAEGLECHASAIRVRFEE